METLQYHSYHHHVPFLPQEPKCPHATLFPSFPAPTNTTTTTTTTTNTNPIFEFSASPPVSNLINSNNNGRTLSPVTDISNSLLEFTVSSPHVSPNDKPSPIPTSPPRSQQKQRVRRNLSLSMDNFVKSSLSSSASEPCLPRTSTQHQVLSSSSHVISSSPIIPRPISPTTPSIPLFELDTQLIDTTTTTTIIKRTSPLKSPKRAREEREREEREQRMQMAEFLLNPPQPLIRSASTSILANNGRESKQRRSLLVKSESFVIRDPSHAILPTIYGQHPDLQYVSPQTVADVIDGRFRNEIDEHYIIDCRFPYEYDGGHINTALNLTENEIKKMFIDMPQSGKKVAIIFHCEFSSQRAPRCLRFLRELDRKLNIAEYPKLSYPDVYVIEGGFKHFFQTFEDYCVGTYVEMRDERHFTEMKAHLRNFKRVRSMSADNTNIPFFQPAKFC